MKETPSAKDAFSERTTSKASRVLPTPPGPSRVSKRTSGCLSRSMTTCTACSRPINGVVAAGSKEDVRVTARTGCTPAAVVRTTEGRTACSSRERGKLFHSSCEKVSAEKPSGPSSSRASARVVMACQAASVLMICLTSCRVRMAWCRPCSLRLKVSASSARAAARSFCR